MTIPKSDRAEGLPLPSHILALVYDCDGVLVDSTRANEAYYNTILAHFGLHPLRPGQVQAIQVLTAEEVIDLLFDGTPFVREAQDFQKVLGNDQFMPLVIMEPFLKETLSRLRGQYGMAVVSNRGKSLRPLLEHLDLTDYFDLVVSSIDVGRPKPDSGYLARVISWFGIEPTQALYIGDSEIDLLTARGAGFPFLSYKNRALSALSHLDTHLDLLRLLDPGSTNVGAEG